MNSFVDRKSLTDGHFAFGDNWTSFAQLLDDTRIRQAELGLKSLFPADELRGARFLDIGCGSGLSALAAVRLGASEVDAIDIDPQSVATAKETLERYAGSSRWTTRTGSVFQLSARDGGDYDIVYSWGVLHHTGDMWRAVRIAASMVKPGGHLAIALYRKTAFCRFWRWEKRHYSSAPRFVQAAIRAAYKAGFCSDMALRQGKSPRSYIRDYHNKRGMDWSHDVHDWLGGYPYESAAREDVAAFLGELGFKVVREISVPPARGLWGTGCDQFVAIREPR